MSHKTKDNSDKIDFQPETPQLRNVSGSSTESRDSARDSGYGGSGYGGSPKSNDRHPEVNRNNKNISVLFFNFVLDLSVNQSDWKNILDQFKSSYQRTEENITNYTNSNNRFSWNSLDRKIWDYQNNLNTIEDDNAIDSRYLQQQKEMREGIAFRMIVSCSDDAIFNLDFFKVLTNEYLSDYKIETSPKIADLKSLISATDQFSNSSLHLLATRIAEKIRNGENLSSCWTVYKEFSKHFKKELENNFENFFEETPTSIVESEGVSIEQIVQFVSLT